MTTGTERKANLFLAHDGSRDIATALAVSASSLGGRKDHIISIIKILQTMRSGLPLVMSLRIRI